MASEVRRPGAERAGWAAARSRTNAEARRYDRANPRFPAEPRLLATTLTYRAMFLASLPIGLAPSLLAGFLASSAAPQDPVAASSVRAARPASSAASQADLTDRFVVPDGLRVVRFAESPQLFNPTAMDVDARGRLWVSEGVNYRQWRGRNAGRHHDEGDRIVILEDTDGDGVADSSKVFVQDPELVAPLGIAVVPDAEGEAIYVSCSPKLFIYRDTDGDDVADDKSVFLEGFGGRDHDHGLHSVVFGPDGALWFNAGNAGPHIVTDRDGWTLRSGSIYKGGGEFTAPNTPGLVSDDGRVWTMGIVLRVGADGRGLRPIAHNFRNPYEVAVDSFGNAYQSDNDDDGNRCCRTVWVVPGGNHGYGAPDGSRMWRADRRPQQETWNAHWHQDDPGVVPAGYRNGGGGPTGVAIYEGGLLDERFVSAVLNADAGAGVVYAHHPKSDGGSGIAFGREDLIAPRSGEAGGERARWFRPSDVCVGTDGSIYVADWFDPGVGGHAARDREAYGRILRIAPASASDPRVVPRAGLAAIASPAANVRAGAWVAARSMSAAEVNREVAQVLARATSGGGMSASERERLAARLVFLRGAFGGDHAKAALQRMLSGTSGALQLAAFRALIDGAGPERTLDLVRSVLESESSHVRSLAAARLRDLDYEACRELLISLVSMHRVGDRASLELLGIACTGKEEALFADLVAAKGLTDPLSWPAHLAEVFWRLHPSGAVRGFLSRALAPGLDAEAREAAVTALAFVPTSQAAEAMAAVARGGPVDVQGLATWWLANRAGNLWSEFEVDSGSALDIRGADVAWRSGVLGVGDRPREAALSVPLDRADVLWLVVEDGGDGNSFDWACWADVRLTGPAGELRIGDAPWIASENGWGELRADRNAGGKPLKLGGKRVRHGIGGHAPSRIAIRVPEGYDRLIGRVGPDDGGIGQGGARTSLEFVVRTASQADRSELEASVTKLLADDTPDAERAQVAVALAADAEGGALLVNLAASGKLSASLKSAVSERIFRNPDVTVRALASAHFERPGLAGLSSLPPIPELAKMSGDALRGREVFFGVQAACSSCHRHRGQGQDFGPDLSMVHRKLDTLALFDSILNPSAGVAFGYEATSIETKDGRVYYGFLLADGPKVVIKDSTGARHVLDASDIASRSVQKQSLMPDTAALALDAQQIADLVAFLEREPFDEARLGDPIRLFDGKSLAGWVGVAGDGRTPTEAFWSVTEEGTLRTTGRPAGYVRTEAGYESFKLTLEWRFTGKPGNGGVLLRRNGPDKVWPRSIEAQLQSRSAGDIWNIDKFGMETAAARTRGRRTQKMQPSSENRVGDWNRYEIWLDGGDLRLVVNGVVQNEAHGCEVLAGSICLQSEGSGMEFRNLVLRPFVRPSSGH